MKTSKFAIGTQIENKKGQSGAITRIITKSTGYVEVTYTNGEIKKEMAFNLINIEGAALKAKPVLGFHTEESAAKLNNKIDAFKKDMRFAELNDIYFESEAKRRLSLEF